MPRGLLLPPVRFVGHIPAHLAGNDPVPPFNRRLNPIPRVLRTASRNAARVSNPTTEPTWLSGAPKSSTSVRALFNLRDATYSGTVMPVAFLNSARNLAGLRRAAAATLERFSDPATLS